MSVKGAVCGRLRGGLGSVFWQGSWQKSLPLGGGSVHQAPYPPPVPLSEEKMRRRLVQDALIAISVALVAVCGYELFQILAAALVGGPQNKSPEPLGGRRRARAHGRPAYPLPVS
jgi:hypothetical protein